MTRPTIQTLTLAGEEYAVVPLAEYEALRNLADEDAVDSSIIQRVLEDPDQELVPFELSTRLADGEHPVRVWREYRFLLKASELCRLSTERSGKLLSVGYREREETRFGHTH